MRRWSRVEGRSREFKELTGLVSSGWTLVDDCNQGSWWEPQAFLNLLNCPSLHIVLVSANFNFPESIAINMPLSFLLSIPLNYFFAPLFMFPTSPSLHPSLYCHTKLFSVAHIALWSDHFSVFDSFSSSGRQFLFFSYWNISSISGMEYNIPSLSTSRMNGLRHTNKPVFPQVHITASFNTVLLSSTHSIHLPRQSSPAPAINALFPVHYFCKDRFPILRPADQF